MTAWVLAGVVACVGLTLLCAVTALAEAAYRRSEAFRELADEIVDRVAR